MKIAVYTITKNEAEFIQRWAKSAQDADYRIIVDTGSIDETVNVARGSRCHAHEINVVPWRFDDARNAALALVPPDVDYCIALDADEILMPGWRAELEKMDTVVTRPQYKYTWSWNDDGSPGLTYGGDKIHARYGYRWKHPVHETLMPLSDEVRAWCGLEIHHHPDDTKSRSSYLPLLELAVREDPTDDRNAHYLAREYFFKGDHERATAEFLRHLSLPKAMWAPERAKSMRLLAACLPNEREKWLLRSAAEDPNRREPWVALSAFYYDHEQWAQCYANATRALSITAQDLSYINEADVWGPLPYDLAALSAHHLGMRDEAIIFGVRAHELAPDDERLEANLTWYAGCWQPDIV